MRKIIFLLTGVWFILTLVNFSKIPLLLFVFIIFAAIERFWETFITSKQSIFGKKVEFDWLFRLVSYYYILIMYSTVIEYVRGQKGLNYMFFIIGLVVFLSALLLRLWSIKALGGNWNTCVLGKVKRTFKPRRLIKRGPYRFIRHPIYVGTVIETVSIPFIFGAYYTLIFVILVYVPLIILRAYLEEKELIKIFGTAYVRYKAKTV